MKLINLMFTALFAAVAVAKSDEEKWQCYTDCLGSCNAPAGGSCEATCLISCQFDYNGGRVMSQVNLDDVVDNINGRLVCF